MTIHHSSFARLVAGPLVLLLTTPCGASAHKINVTVTGDFTNGVTKVEIKIVEGQKADVPVHV